MRGAYNHLCRILGVCIYQQVGRCILLERRSGLLYTWSVAMGVYIHIHNYLNITIILNAITNGGKLKHTWSMYMYITCLHCMITDHLGELVVNSKYVGSM